MEWLEWGERVLWFFSVIFIGSLNYKQGYMDASDFYIKEVIKKIDKVKNGDNN